MSADMMEVMLKPRPCDMQGSLAENGKEPLMQE
jgi:hypothetical protein